MAFIVMLSLLWVWLVGMMVLQSCRRPDSLRKILQHGRTDEPILKPHNTRTLSNENQVLVTDLRYHS